MCNTYLISIVMLLLMHWIQQVADTVESGQHLVGPLYCKADDFGALGGWQVRQVLHELLNETVHLNRIVNISQATSPLY